MGTAVDNGDDKVHLSDREGATIQAQNYAVVDLRGRPADKSRTGTWKAAPFTFAMNLVDFQLGVGIAVNLVPYLFGTMHKSISQASNITTDFLGTFYLLSVLGGFLADSYLGSFYTICVGGITALLGTGLLTASTALNALQPPSCPDPTGITCKPASGRYMAPLFVALYTIALGTGLVKPNTVALGGDQFDDSNPKEMKSSVNFYIWFYFSLNVGLLLSFTLGIYLHDDVSRAWGYSFSLMLYAVCFLFFVLGATKFRHKVPTGSFLTRTAQVLVASLRKWKVPRAASPQELYNPPPTVRLSFKLKHTYNMRYFDRAAIIDGTDKEALARENPNLWRLCSVTQVEETKRLIQLVPVCLTTSSVTLVFSQLSTFVVTQGSSLDRNLGKHFTLPPASLSGIVVLMALIAVPIYDKLLIPLARRFTKCPYGFAPLQRLGASLVCACLSMIMAAIIERKRLTYVRGTPFEDQPLGSYVLPMKFWYLLPQFFFASHVELFLYVASYEFFYHESAGSTRRVGSSFTYTSSFLGYFFSTIIVNITNHVTRHEKHGAWLENNLNNGGLEKFHWLLAVFIFVNFLCYLVAAYCYTYKHDWYGLQGALPQRDTSLARNQVDNVDDSG